MSILGTTQTLFVNEMSNEGAYLDGRDLGEVFLPSKEIDYELEAGDSVQVFIYLDHAGHPTGTTKKPLAEVGEFALLRVKAINITGAFMDWGLEKDVLAPQRTKAKNERRLFVSCTLIPLDNASQRICASSNFNKFLSKEEPTYAVMEEVDLIVAGKTDLGYKVLVNEAHIGVVYYNTVFKKLFVGQRLKGFIQKYVKTAKSTYYLKSQAWAK